MKTLAQCILESRGQRLEAWLDAERIKPGFSVTLKNSNEPTRWWDILHMSSAIDSKLIKTDRDSKAIHEKDFHGSFNGFTSKALGT